MRALILVDLQRDFLPGGALAVPEGDQVLPVAEALVIKSKKRFDVIVATQDHHPTNHQSFASNNPGQQVGDLITLHGQLQVLWPDHCVQGTPGAELMFSSIVRSRLNGIFPKGLRPEVDSYSGFYDNGGRHSTGLGEYLSEQKVDEVVVMGLATDYCVKFTALDARRLGLKTYLVVDGCRGVNLSPGDDRKAIDEMKVQGVRLSKAIDWTADYVAATFV